MRKSRGVSALLGFVVVIAGAVAPAGVVAADTGGHGAEVSAAVRHDVSPPLRAIHVAAPSAANLTERPLYRLNPGRGSGPDTALQTTTGTSVAVTSPSGFEGIGQGQYGFTVQYAPPDTNGAVGATQYVQWVNTYLGVFDKTTHALQLIQPGNAVWAGFGGGCQTNNDGDPIVQYDKIASRWILTQFSVSTKPYLQCVAVSTTSDATGSYNRYAFSYGSSDFPDYPKLAVWPDAYYISYNVFGSVFFTGAKVCAFDRAAMLAGAAATQQCFQLSSSFGGLLPSDLDGSTASLQPGGSGLPPAGSPNFFVNFGSNALRLWKFHVDWANSANTTLSGPSSISVAGFTTACNGGGTCIPQPGTSQKLDSLGDRLMYRLAYRHFADGHEALVVNHSVANGSVTGVRWYELNNASGQTLASATPVVHQQGTFAPNDGIHRWMGSIAMDAAGNIALGYSASNSSVYPSVRLTGRLATDALGSMQSETILRAGTGSQLANLSRWGDYSAMTVDPVDDCTFWYTSEYLKTNGTWNWSTWIASFSFSGCSVGGGGPTTGTVSGYVTDASTSSPISGATVSASPGGTSTTTDGSGHYTLTLAGGTYDVTASAVGYNSSTSTGLVVSNGSDTPQSFVLTPSGGGGATVPGAPAQPTASAGPGKGITVRWSAPTTDGGSPLTGYVLSRYLGCNLASTPATFTFAASTTSTKDTTTSKGSSYCYIVAATNAVGTGADSPPSNTVTATK